MANVHKPADEFGWLTGPGASPEEGQHLERKDSLGASVRAPLCVGSVRAHVLRWPACPLCTEKHSTPFSTSTHPCLLLVAYSCVWRVPCGGTPTQTMTGIPFVVCSCSPKRTLLRYGLSLPQHSLARAVLPPARHSSLALFHPPSIRSHSFRHQSVSRPNAPTDWYPSITANQLHTCRCGSGCCRRVETPRSRLRERSCPTHPI